MTHIGKQFLVLVLWLALATPALAQEPRPKSPAQPALVQIKDTPGLPRVLLIGDSISMGYTLAVRKELSGKANVHRPATNCGPTTRGLTEIEKWLGDGKWDVIHFNFGLHDLKYVDSDGKNIEPAKGRPQVSRDDYRNNLDKLVAKMKKTGAKLIFCTTTPVPEGSAARLPGDELAYNKIAVDVMQGHGVAINDLYAFALPRLKEIQRPANVHFTPEGSEVLAKQVAASISRALAMAGVDDQPTDWRALPLVKEGKVDPAWVQIGYGGFAVDKDTLRTDCSEKGLGLLVYSKEKFGDCQIRVVYKSKDAKSNAGVYVRMDDGILKQVDQNHSPAKRDSQGNLTDDSLQVFKDASEKEQGAWYAVHHGYEIQICDSGGKRSRTGAVYSLAESTSLSDKPPTEWKEMTITLQGNLVFVDIDGKRVTTFDPQGKDVPADRQWHEPKREVKRPTAGYIGLQNHDPGDEVYFKAVSVRPLPQTK